MLHSYLDCCFNFQLDLSNSFEYSADGMEVNSDKIFEVPRMSPLFSKLQQNSSTAERKKVLGLILAIHTEIILKIFHIAKTRLVVFRLARLSVFNSVDEAKKKDLLNELRRMQSTSIFGLFSDLICF